MARRLLVLSAPFDASRRVSLLIATAVLLLCAPSARAQYFCDGLCFHASPSGTGGTCTEAIPCSLDTAFSKVVGSVPFLTSDVHVVLRGGTYPLSQTVTLGFEHSAPPPFKTIIEAYPNEKPVLSGGVAVTGWSALPNPNPLNIWSATAPAGVSNRELYVNGVRATRARGYFNQPFQQDLS